MNFKVRKPRGLTTGNLMFGTLIGTLSGIYIWNAPLQQYMREEEQKKQQALEKTQQDETVKKIEDLK